MPPWWLVPAQAGDPTSLVDPSLWTQFGPFAIVFVVMTILGGGIITWLLRDRSRQQAAHEAALAATKRAYDEDVESHRRQLDAERQANRDMVDRLIASAERTAPILERAVHVMERAR